MSVEKEFLSKGLVEVPALDGYDDALQLVRLLQCQKCTLPYRQPVSLACGRSICRACLPLSHTQTHTSYLGCEEKNTFTCPFEECSAEHILEQTAVDVMLSNVVNWCLQLETGESRLKVLYQTAAEGSLAFGEQEVVHCDPTWDRAFARSMADMLTCEFECLVCYAYLHDAVTTGCGHTFCRRCLARVLDHSTACPMCRHALPSPSYIPGQPCNSTIRALQDALDPEAVQVRQFALEQEDEKGLQNNGLDTPIFVCCLSYPRMPTFLHIFEPKYRLMMRRAMESGTRRFGMVLPNAHRVQQDLGETPFMETGTMLEIRNLELLPDGRSLVETTGSFRFKVVEWGQRDGYTVGKTIRIDDDPIEVEEEMEAQEVLHPQQENDKMTTAQLIERCKEFARQMTTSSPQWLLQRLQHTYGEAPEDPAVFAYWLASIVPIADEEKYRMLSTTTVRDRYKLVLEWIEKVEGQSWFSTSGCSLQ